MSDTTYTISRLPAWPGAEHCYSQAYRLLERWGAANYAAAAASFRGRHRRVGGMLEPTDEMKALIDALNKGSEETIKGILMLGEYYRTY